MLTEFQKQKLPRLFAVHDLNHDGQLNREDFEEYTRGIASTRGWGPESTEYQELLSRFLTFWEGLSQQAGRDRNVTVKDWLAYWDNILARPEVYDQLIDPIGRMVFTILDKDGDGSVTEEEYATTFRAGGLDPEDAAPAFARLDLDHDGKLSVDEIMTLADDFFRSNDPDAPGNALFGVVRQ